MFDRTLAETPARDRWAEEPCARQAQASGSSLHAGALAEADEREKLERLCRCLARHGVGRRQALAAWTVYPTYPPRSRGLRNRANFRNAIYFHLGGLDLYPDAIYEAATD